MTKRIHRMALYLLLSVLLTALLSSCASASKYKPVPSSAEERATVITFTAGKKTYQVPFELYRTFFLLLKTSVDGGDASVWSGAEKETYRQTVNDMIAERLYEIYSVFALADAVGYNAYSGQVDSEVEALIEASVEGGYLNDTYLPGYDSYEDYLADLRANYLNYSVQDLLYRYAIAEDAVQSYYIGSTSGSYVENTYLGVLTYTEDELRAFYNDDTTIRLIWLYTPKNIVGTEAELQSKLTERRDAMRAIAADCSNLSTEAQKIAEYVLGKTTDPASEVIRGQLISPYNLSRLNYGNLISAAQSLAVGDVSEPIEVVTDAFCGYFILYRAEKPESWFSDMQNRDALIKAYLQNGFGRKLAEKETELRASIRYTDEILSMDLASISMD